METAYSVPVLTLYTSQLQLYFFMGSSSPTIGAYNNFVNMVTPDCSVLLAITWMEFTVHLSNLHRQSSLRLINAGLVLTMPGLGSCVRNKRQVTIQDNMVITIVLFPEMYNDFRSQLFNSSLLSKDKPSLPDIL